MCLVKPLIYGHIGSSRVNEMDKGEEAMVQKKLQQKIYVKLETEKIGVLLGESCVSCLVSPSPQV